MTDENGAPDRFRTGTAADEDPSGQSAVEDPSDQHVPEEDDRLLSWIPEWVVVLGAGSLFTATLITLVGTGFLWYSVFDGRFYGYEPYKVVLLAVQFTAVTAFQAVGVRWARNRIRWMWVMLAAVAGSLTFVPLPFTALTLLCVGLGRHHFTFHTPRSVIRGDE
jgi:hypothetical protein